MNKLPSSADCRLSEMIYLSCGRRKSELRPVCLPQNIFQLSWKIFQNSMACPVAVGPIIKLYKQKQIFRGWLHQFSWKCKKCFEFQFLCKNNGETYAVKKTKTAPTSLTRTAPQQLASQADVGCFWTQRSSAWKQINSILKSLPDINLLLTVRPIQTEHVGAASIE